MTPDEIDLILADGALVRADADGFASSFYDTLFEIAPATRQLFPDDMTSQRGKLVDELAFLIEAVTPSPDGATIETFLDRAHDLGRRHVEYGVQGSHYAPVRTALLAALRTRIDGWGPEHHDAWDKLFRLISDVMREGAESSHAAGPA